MMDLFITGMLFLLFLVNYSSYIIYYKNILIELWIDIIIG